MLCPLDVYMTQDQLGGMADISRLLSLWLFVIPCHYCGKCMYTGHAIAVHIDHVDKYNACNEIGHFLWHTLNKVQLSKQNKSIAADK